ncbi:hypothetical protein CONLIGDRAFT_667429 [Coniochaeta ligniaria NRRL 30616]|uniref:DUF7587 domain-containing protein n=1 Tax=Coniochaeta ligniaria NRRL 30616 TaxID=1408157 RepID=A0A1J7JDZ5_9PEZI|nr:hypothetical protein CONLIGDRAFT_667429 [Coniochaeta ligniaria NRRL 30616]
MASFTVRSLGCRVRLSRSAATQESRCTRTDSTTVRSLGCTTCHSNKPEAEVGSAATQESSSHSPPLPWCTSADSTTVWSVGCRVLYGSDEPEVEPGVEPEVEVRSVETPVQPAHEAKPESSSHSTAQLPEYFYRVQRDGTGIIEHTDGSFEARSRYWMNSCQCGGDEVPIATWTSSTTRLSEARSFRFLITAVSSYQHSATSLGITPVIEDAVTLAWYHMHRRKTGIHSSKIETKTLRPKHLDLRFGDTAVRMPVWVEEGGCTFLSVRDVQEHLGAREDEGLGAECTKNVRYYLGQRGEELGGPRSEWFALDFIPAEMVQRDRYWGSMEVLNEAAREIKREICELWARRVCLARHSACCGKNDESLAVADHLPWLRQESLTAAVTGARPDGRWLHLQRPSPDPKTDKVHPADHHLMSRRPQLKEVEVRSEAQLPLYFYRVQHDRSATDENPDGSFSCRYRLQEDYSDFRYALHRHLTWKDRRATPFISVFNNGYLAEERARFHVNSGDTGVHTCRIDPRMLREGYLELRPFEMPGAVRLPVWMWGSRCTFVSTADVRKYLGVRDGIGQNSEWFALGVIPAGMVLNRRDYSLQPNTTLLS